MSMIRCYDCDRALDTADAEYRKYGDIALCQGCALVRQEKAEAEELKADKIISDYEGRQE
jgi:hypothetical protein